MSLARGKYGVEYNPRQSERDPSGFGWIAGIVIVVVVAIFAWRVARRIHSASEEDSPPQAVLPPLATAPSPPSVVALTTETFKTFSPLETTLVRRPSKVRNLLLRLEEAERRRDVEMAVTTIEDLRSLPGTPAADLDDALARRLGALNVRRLYDLKNAQWVKQVVVKRGDSASRIAAENGSSLASFARLNGGRVDKVILGKSLYVMDHPRFSLVVRCRTRIADLSLNGKFFKRYDLSDAPSAKVGAYELPERKRQFWPLVGIAFGAADRAEIEELLPAGTPVLISEM